MAGVLALLHELTHLEDKKNGGVCGTVERLALQCGAPKIAKLVYNSNNYGLWYL